MVPRKSNLNNMSIQNYRKNPLYQAVVTDLCLEGVIPKDKAEAILGYEIPSSMKGPTGRTLEAEAAKPQSVKKKKDSGQTELDIGTAKE